MKLTSRMDRQGNVLPRYNKSKGGDSEDVTGKNKYRTPFYILHHRNKLLVAGCSILIGLVIILAVLSQQQPTTLRQDQSTEESISDQKILDQDHQESLNTKNQDNINGEGKADVIRRDAVEEEFLHAWNAYKAFGWGRDDLHPISKRGTDGYKMALTLIDSLSTILVMGLDEEAKLCRAWIDQHLKFGTQKDISVFESTIRVMGGLLSAYAMTKDALYKAKAMELADYLIVAFDTKTGLPMSAVDFPTRHAFIPGWSGGATSVSEAGTLQLEWRYLSEITGNPLYAQKVDVTTEQLSKTPNKPNGLFTKMINTSNGKLQDNIITLGARVDSIYEYFLKAWVQSGKTDTMNLDLYNSHVQSIIDHLVVTSPAGLVYFQELVNGTPVGKMDHLVCFMGGMLALGAHTILDRAGDMKLAEEFGETCYNMYKQMPTGLSPEIVRFEPDLQFDKGARHNLLRPETVESLFYLWRLTHDEKYRDWGWEIFEAFRKYCRVPEGGYSNLIDVTHEASPQSLWQDKMESFFLAETLKYLYLLFDDDSNIPLDEWVFNTEAHPLPILQHRQAVEHTTKEVV